VSTMTTSILLIVILAFSLTGVVLGILWLYRNGPASRVRGRITTLVKPEISQSTETSPLTEGSDFLKSGVSRFRNWLNKVMSGLSSETMQVKLSSAYWPITDVEFIAIRITSALLGFVLGWLVMRNLLGGIFLGIFIILIPPFVLERSIIRRQHKFHNQLLDVLILIKGAIQAGYSLSQALDMALTEIPPPSSEEFGRVLKEVQFGYPLEQALTNLAERMENDDLHIVVTAIIINSQVGGNLSTVLESTINTIRNRMQLSAEIQSLTSYARYLGNFLSFLPFVAGIFIFIINPNYFDTVTNSLLVQIIFAMALIGIILGNVWLRRVARIRV
jgi:tight adherence protein B